MTKWRRLPLAALAGCLAVMLGSGSVLAAPGDVTLLRLSGLGGEDYWLGTALTPSSVYVGGTRNDTAVLRRYNRSGGVVWTRTLVTPGSGPALIWSVAADASGVYAVGEYTTKERHGFVARYYPNGTFVWLQPLGLGIPSFAKGVNVRDSAVYVTGVFSVGADVGELDSSFVRRYTTDGDEVWTRTIEPDPKGYLVSAETRSVATTADRVFVVGDANVAEDPPAPNPRVLVRSYDLDGNYPTTDTYAIGNEAHGYGVAADDSAAYVVAQSDALSGDSMQPFGSFLLKYDDTGAFVWQRRITARSRTTAWAVAVAASGVWITGGASDRLTNRPGTSSDPHGDAFAVRYSRSGSPLLTYQYSAPGHQAGRAIDVDGNGAFIAGTAARFGSQVAVGPLDGLLLGVEVP